MSSTTIRIASFGLYQREDGEHFYEGRFIPYLSEGGERVKAFFYVYYFSVAFSSEQSFGQRGIISGWHILIWLMIPGRIHINMTEVGKIFTRSQPQRTSVNSQRIKHECNDYGKTFIRTLPKRGLTHEQPYKSYKFGMISAWNDTFENIRELTRNHKDECMETYKSG